MLTEHNKKNLSSQKTNKDEEIVQIQFARNVFVGGETNDVLSIQCDYKKKFVFISDSKALRNELNDLQSNKDELNTLNKIIGIQNKLYAHSTEITFDDITIYLPSKLMKKMRTIFIESGNDSESLALNEMRKVVLKALKPRKTYSFACLFVTVH